MQPIPYPRIIFFIASSNPTDEEYYESLQYGPGVVFRHAGYAGAERPELADAVAALSPDLIPDNYRQYPTPDDAMRNYRQKVDELGERVRRRRDLAADVTAEPTVSTDDQGGPKQDVSPGTPGAIGHSWNTPGSASLAPLNEQPLRAPEPLPPAPAAPGMVPPTPPAPEAPTVPPAPPAPLVPPAPSEDDPGDTSGKSGGRKTK